VTLVELLAASALTVAVMGGVLSAVLPAQALFVRESERIDAVQRLRFGVDTLTRDVREATGVALLAEDAIEIRRGAARRVYYRSREAAQLRHVDEDGTDLPVLDRVAALRFELAAGAVRIHLADAGAGPLRVTWDVALRNIGRAP
jgi:hypothetical protein